MFCCTQTYDCVLSSIADIPCEVRRGHQKIGACTWETPTLNDPVGVIFGPKWAVGDVLWPHACEEQY